MTCHPLDPLSPVELKSAAAILRASLLPQKVYFKYIDLLEPSKDEVWAAMAGGVALLSSASIDRRARVYCHVGGSQTLTKATVNMTQSTVDTIEELPDVQGPVDLEEWEQVHDACNAHPLVKAEVDKLKLPLGAKVVNDPWAFGTDDEAERRRLFQCYMYIVLVDDPEANHYSIPASFSPVFDAHTLELLWIDHLPTGSGLDTDTETPPWIPVQPVEYSQGLLPSDYLRTDLKPLTVSQPQGPSFTCSGRTVSWQKWTFQLGWTVREGPVLHGVCYDGRSLFYRVSISEMTVPYGDPRSPFHRKQAFDLGDSGFGLMSNSLRLGCDCLGTIKYFDGYRISATGEPIVMPNVVCMHEVDQGIGWKHTNFRNSRTSVVRDRQLVIQCTATVANYEYIVAYVLDQAANLHVEIRATGIVSTMPVQRGVETPWGTVVAPGVMAVNHQHLFSLRIDPALDGRNNTIVYDDCEPLPRHAESNPHGCAFQVKTTPVSAPGAYDLDISRSRTYKIINESHINPVSGKPVGYKLHAQASQMMMMGSDTFNHRRGVFASRPIWVTTYRDDELYAAGEFTNQSRTDTGLAIWSERRDNALSEDVVLWHSFGLTHVTRPEDFPVMPNEMIRISLKPANFFTVNPSNDVPRSNQAHNRSSEVK